MDTDRGGHIVRAYGIRTFGPPLEMLAIQQRKQ